MIERVLEALALVSLCVGVLVAAGMTAYIALLVTGVIS